MAPKIDPSLRIYLDVPFEENEKAKSLGLLRWDRTQVKWYTTAEHVHKFKEYDPQHMERPDMSTPVENKIVKQEDITRAMSKFVELGTIIKELTAEQKKCRSIIDQHLKSNQLSSKDHTIKDQQYTIKRSERLSSVWKSKEEIPESIWTMYHTTKSTTYITYTPAKRKEMEIMQHAHRLLPNMNLS